MKNQKFARLSGLFLILLSVSVGHAFETPEYIELSSEAATSLRDNLSAEAERKNSLVEFGGGRDVTVYEVKNARITCYIQNADDSVSCTISKEEGTTVSP